MFGRAVKSSSAQAVLGGDWNMDPTELCGSAFAAEGGWRPLFMADSRKTADGFSTLDYFLVDAMAAKGSKQVMVDTEWRAKPHLPVKLMFHPVLSWRKP